MAIYRNRKPRAQIRDLVFQLRKIVGRKGEGRERKEERKGK